MPDIPDITQLSFNAGIFQAVSKCWSQVRGTSMGNQVSPIVSAIAVSYVEKCWQQTYNSWWISHRQHMFIARYVDNRIAVSSNQQMQSRPMQLFAQSEFYGPPVILETVPDTHILGFNVNVQQRTITYIQPTHDWQFRSPHSAGTLQLNLSGYRSRITLIAMYSYPPRNVPHQINNLKNTYIQLYAPQAQSTHNTLQQHQTNLHINKHSTNGTNIAQQQQILAAIEDITSKVIQKYKAKNTSARQAS